MKILVGCEKTQAVTKELRKLGYEAYSCDIQECTGGHPEWHIKCDLISVMYTEIKYDMLIAFPPCTHLAVSGSGSFEQKRKDGRQQEAIDFFMNIVGSQIDKIAIENPIGIMSTIYRKPDQIIHPYYFGDDYAKSTCLWLKNLPRLIHIPEDDLFDKKTHVEPVYIEYNSSKTKSGKSKYSKYGKLGKGKGDERSVTPIGLAKAMADQWGKLIKQKNETIQES